MKQYKAALVGYGGMGHWHFEGICKTDRVKFVGVYDIDPKRMELAKSEGFEKLYDSYEAMLADASLDIIVVATPNNFHKTLVCQALGGDSEDRGDDAESTQVDVQIVHSYHPFVSYDFLCCPSSKAVEVREYRITKGEACQHPTKVAAGG